MTAPCSPIVNILSDCLSLGGFVCSSLRLPRLSICLSAACLSLFLSIWCVFRDDVLPHFTQQIDRISSKALPSDIKIVVTRKRLLD